MIIVEDRFAEVFNFIPDVQYPGAAESYTPIFKYGDDKELNTFLKYSESRNEKPYPLIWLLYPYVEKHQKNKVELPSVSFILAVDTTSAMMNPERIEETYKKILIPLYDNFIAVLSKNNIINIEHNFNVIKYPNYSDDNSTGDKNKTISRWDALKVNFRCTINKVCLKDIKI